MWARKGRHASGSTPVSRAHPACALRAFFSMLCEFGHIYKYQYYMTDVLSKLSNVPSRVHYNVSASRRDIRYFYSDDFLTCLVPTLLDRELRDAFFSCPYLYVEALIKLQCLAKTREHRRQSGIQRCARIEPQQGQVAREKVERCTEASARGTKYREMGIHGWCTPTI